MIACWILSISGALTGGDNRLIGRPTMQIGIVRTAVIGLLAVAVIIDHVSEACAAGPLAVLGGAAVRTAAGATGRGTIGRAAVNGFASGVAHRAGEKFYDELTGHSPGSMASPSSEYIPPSNASAAEKRAAVERFYGRIETSDEYNVRRAREIYGTQSVDASSHVEYIPPSNASAAEKRAAVERFYGRSETSDEYNARRAREIYGTQSVDVSSHSEYIPPLSASAAEKRAAVERFYGRNETSDEYNVRRAGEIYGTRR